MDLLKLKETHFNRFLIEIWFQQLVILRSFIITIEETIEFELYLYETFHDFLKQRKLL